MGISLELYRARIGGFACRSNHATDCRQELTLDDIAYLASHRANSLHAEPIVISIGSKLACLTLLMLAVSALCHEHLLVIGGVEQNPGPPTSKDVLARLCIDTSANEVRDCIRLYNLERDYTSNRKKLSGVTIETLIKTMTYLGIPGQEVFVKPTVVHNLICRIQNLLPDNCPICSEEYCVGKDELGLLPCSICGQACHAPCVLGLLGMSESDISFGPNEAKMRMNPHNLPGIFYICRECEKNHIPSDETGKKRRNGKQSTSTTAEEESLTLSQTVLVDEAQDTPPLLEQDERKDESHHNPQHGAENFESSSESDHPDPVHTGNAERKRNDDSQGKNISSPKPVCPFYRRGTCRHGISGKGCSKPHPTPCRKLLSHGTRGPRGCTKGTGCDRFHPKMCPSSLNHAECFSESCKLRHVRGTRKISSQLGNTTQRYNQRQESGDQHNDSGHINRRPSVTRGHTTQRGKQRQESGNQHRNNGRRNNHPSVTPHQADHFLAAIVALKRELLEAMDSKLQSIQSVATNPSPVTPAVVPQHMYPQHMFPQTYPYTQRVVGHPPYQMAMPLAPPH